jgi:hypothetical protein
VVLEKFFHRRGNGSPALWNGSSWRFSAIFERLGEGAEAPFTLFVHPKAMKLFRLVARLGGK